MRGLTGGNTDTVPYRLYKNVARDTPWGNGSNAVTGAGSGIAQPLTVYGRVLGASVNVAPGDYQDAVTVSVTY